MTISTRPVEAEDYENWRALYEAYAAFYREPQTDEQPQRVWSWLMDPDREVTAAVAVDAEGRLVGLAHYRPFARPLWRVSRLFPGRPFRIRGCARLRRR